HFRLGVAQADAEQFGRAVENFRMAERLATNRDRVEGKPLGEVSRRERHCVLLRWASAARAAKRWEDAAAELTHAAGNDFVPADRLRAVRALCELWRQAGKPDRAALVCQRVLSDRSLQRAHVIDVAGNPQAGRQWAFARLNELLRAYGQEVNTVLEEALKE